MAYYKELYSLQDKFLSELYSQDSPFYLTGGTALSRFYLKHRWSDDLDFFVNNDSNFVDKSRFIISPYSHDVPKMLLGYLSEPHYYDGQYKAKIIEETNGEINDCHFGEYGHKIQSEYFHNHIINNLQYPTNENRD
jgi:predicted nucleotidyltransferase component of viral defense system